MLRAECAAAGLVGAGSLDVLKSIRAWLDNIAYSFGAIWTPEMARLYPTADSRGIRTFNSETAQTLVVNGTLEDACDILRVSYNVDQSNDRAQRYVELSARPYRYGGVGAEVVLPWLRTPRNAESVGRRMLQRMAGTLAVHLTTNDVTVRPGQWRRIEAHPEWPRGDANPVAMVLATDITPDAASAEVDLEYVIDPPTIVVTAHSVAVPPGVGAAVDVEIVGGEAIFGIADENGRSLINALVSLDGGAPKKTNAQGQVSFTITPSMPPKKHQLAVEAAGYTPFLLDVYL